MSTVFCLCLSPFASRLLPLAHDLLPTVSCILPLTYCLLPPVSCLLSLGPINSCGVQGNIRTCGGGDREGSRRWVSLQRAPGCGRLPSFRRHVRQCCTLLETRLCFYVRFRVTLKHDSDATVASDNFVGAVTSAARFGSFVNCSLFMRKFSSYTLPPLLSTYLNRAPSPTGSVPALQGCECLWSYEYSHLSTPPPSLPPLFRCILLSILIVS